MRQLLKNQRCPSTVQFEGSKYYKTPVKTHWEINYSHCYSIQKLMRHSKQGALAKFLSTHYYKQSSIYKMTHFVRAACLRSSFLFCRTDSSMVCQSDWKLLKHSGAFLGSSTTRNSKGPRVRTLAFSFQVKRQAPTLVWKGFRRTM